MTDGPHIVVLEHDPHYPLGRLEGWLTGAGATVDIRALHHGDALPDDASAFDALVSLGGELGVDDVDSAPWLSPTTTVLAEWVRLGKPVLGIGLSAQLLAVATGGRVDLGADGPEIGAHFGAKRDAAEQDLLFGEVPISPDVMQFHRDVITALPAGSVLLMASLNYPVQAFRVGAAAWGIQFHIETTADDVRGWAADHGAWATSGDLARAERRLGPILDEAEGMMASVWGAFAERFVAAARDGIAPTPLGWAGPRLPLVGHPGSD